MFRDPQGEYIDHDIYRHDLAERNHVELVNLAGVSNLYTGA